MLSRNLTPTVRLHVYTEASRPVPEPFIKHSLTNWGIAGPKQSWWYKMQLFNASHHAGNLLYFDLDTVIVNNIDWIWQCPTTHFWAVRDFKYLWRSNYTGLNSSIMWWDTEKFNYVWEEFCSQQLDEVRLQWRGDQDYITATIIKKHQRFFDPERIKSWRWQCLDGGFNFEKKRHLKPNTGTQFTDRTGVLIFHGSPKPGDVQDPVILQYWQ
jgi:hypothetical protein